MLIVSYFSSFYFLFLVYFCWKQGRWGKAKLTTYFSVLLFFYLIKLHVYSKNKSRANSWFIVAADPCNRNKANQQKNKLADETWLTCLIRLHITYFFLIGSSNFHVCLVTIFKQHDLHTLSPRGNACFLLTTSSERETASERRKFSSSFPVVYVLKNWKGFSWYTIFF